MGYSGRFNGSESSVHGARDAPGDAPFAGIWRRSLAWLVDVVAVSALVFVGVSIGDAVLEPTVRFRPEATTLRDVLSADEGRVLVNAALGTALSAGYFVVTWVLLGGSPAQLALRIRVRRGRDDVPLRTGRALVRWLLLFPPFATVSALTAGRSLVGALVWGLAVAWYLVLFTTTALSDTKQGLHDRVADSVVLARLSGRAYGGGGVR
jgi:hypothetical protein